MIKKVFPLLALATFTSLLGAGIIAPLLPLYAESLGANDIWLGIISAAFFISGAIFMPITGRLSDRTGRKAFISTGLAIYTIASIGYIWASSISQLTFVRLLQGAAFGTITPVAQAYIGDISPEGEEGRWMGYFNACFFIGFGVGPLIGGVLTDHFGMPAAFYSMTGLSLMAFLLVAFLLPEARPKKMAINPKLSIKELGANRMVRGLTSFRFSFGVGRGAFTTFLPVFAAIYLHLSPTVNGLLLAVNLMLMSTLQFFTGRIADRFNRRSLVILGSLANLAYLALIPQAHNLWYLLGLCALGGLGTAIAIPAASAMTVEEGRKLGMGSTMGIFITAFSIGMAVGPLISGVIANVADINSVFYFAAAIALAGPSLFIWFTRRHEVAT